MIGSFLESLQLSSATLHFAFRILDIAARSVGRSAAWYREERVLSATQKAALANGVDFYPN